MEIPQVLSLGIVNTPPRQPRAPSTPSAPRRQGRGPFQSPRFVVSNACLSRRLFVGPDSSSSQPPAADHDDPDACQVCHMLEELAALASGEDDMDTE
jgi:hypothetical protein